MRLDHQDQDGASGQMAAYQQGYADGDHDGYERALAELRAAGVLKDAAPAVAPTAVA